MSGRRRLATPPPQRAAVVSREIAQPAGGLAAGGRRVRPPRSWWWPLLLLALLTAAPAEGQGRAAAAPLPAGGPGADGGAADPGQAPGAAGAAAGDARTSTSGPEPSGPAPDSAGSADGGDAGDGGWSNATELSVVRTQGNAATQTLGFSHTLQRRWRAARVQLRLDGVRSRTAGERLLVVRPGVRFQPGSRPTDVETTAARAPGAPDVDRYFVEGRVERTLSDRVFWNAGLSWDRNHDAGIRRRTVTFGGFGTAWAAGDDLEVSTAYGFSYTVRAATGADPARDDRFGGWRVDGDYRQRLGDAVTLDGDTALNVNLLAASDYSLTAASGVSVAMSEHLSLRVSLQALYEHQPAFEPTAIRAYVALIDPDGRPGSGDELFETVPAGGTVLDLGAGSIPKRALDSIVRTALVIDF